MQICRHKSCISTFVIICIYWHWLVDQFVSLHGITCSHCTLTHELTVYTHYCMPVHSQVPFTDRALSWLVCYKDDRPTQGLLPTIFVFMLHLYIITNQPGRDLNCVRRQACLTCTSCSVLEYSESPVLWSCSSVFFCERSSFIHCDLCKLIFNLEGSHKEDFRDFWKL